MVDSPDARVPDERCPADPVVRSKFSSQLYAAEFGRYEGTRAAEHPAHELLVGREGQRAHFLNVLQTFGRKGAILVTGHRGSGKTTFVRFCLDEYTNNVFRRFLRSNSGRTFLWDRIGHLVFGILWILGTLLVTEELQELALLPHRSVLDWLLVFLLSLLCGYPLLAAKELFELTLRVDPPRYSESPSSSRLVPTLVSSICLLAAGWVLSFWGPLGAPELALSELFAVGGWMYLVVNLLSFSAKPLPDDPGSQDPSYTLARQPERLRSWLGLAAIFTALILIVFLPTGSTRLERGLLVGQNLVLGIVLLAFGTLRRALDQIHLAATLASRAAHVGADATSNSVLFSAQWHLGAGVILGGTGLTLNQGGPLSAHALICVIASAVLFLLGSLLRKVELWRGNRPPVFRWLLDKIKARPDQKVTARPPFLAWLRREFKEWRATASSGQAPQEPFSLHPRPRVLLIFKAVVLLCLGLQLSYPLAVALSPKRHEQEKATHGGRAVQTLQTRLGSTADETPLSLAAHWAAKGERRGLFNTTVQTTVRAEENRWLLGVVLLVCFFVFVEYEWIVRPYALVRDDEALHGPHAAVDSGRTSAKGDLELQRLQRSVRRKYHKLAEQTFFWSAFKTWLPVLVAPVNLGFDSLEHRHVIEAMLAGLKASYRRAFLHWSSFLVIARRLIVGGIIVALTLFAGMRWFGEPAEPKPCSMEAPPALLNLACMIGTDRLARFLDWQPLRISDDAELPEWTYRGLLLQAVVRFGSHQPRPGSLHVYHFVIFLLLLTAARALRSLKILPLAPYRQTYDRISRVLDSLSSRLREETRPDGSKMTQVLSVFFGSPKSHGKEFGPFDPRTVELAFLEILADCQNPAIHLPFTARSRVNPPIPEIVFVFDELDKIGSSGQNPFVTSAPLAERKSTAAGDELERESLNLERRRSRALHRLFADLKNILSSGAARFIFIGGQNLHDEWLADEMAKTPRLTNTFDAQIHLTSLLTDSVAGKPSGRLRLEGVRSFVREHWRRARWLHESWQQKATAPWLCLSVEERYPVSFVQGVAGPEERQGFMTAQDFALTIRRCDDGSVWKWSRPFNDALFEFLAYRSRGNAKKLRGLIESFIRPLGRFVPSPSVRHSSFDSEHILLFHDVDRFRIQLVADIFRQLNPVLGERLGFGDDKLAQTIFYVADFLLRFHRRAFTVSNLGMIDEMAHIHRSPDLRLVIEEIALGWSAKYFHLIINGMYDYRFESGFARELEFLSHHSELELAAFNFTLDESEDLKGASRSRLDPLNDTQAIDSIIGLGELHEFDEEFEMARYYYLRAARALDDEFRFQVMKKDDLPVSFEVLDHLAKGYSAVRRVATWGVARVRLMLQIAMTYERARDYERAQVEYRDARTLASSVVQALLGWQQRSSDVRRVEEHGKLTPAEADAGGYLWTLKSISILFHPVFAEAWLAEKTVAGVETGPSLLEKELYELRQRLPFVSEPLWKRQVPANAAAVRHSNFALTMAELHNRTGSLYFFKGRQLVTADQVSRRVAGEVDALNGSEGYMLKAVSHYAISLHEVRRFNRYRREASKYKLSDFESPHETIAPFGWPEFVYRVEAGALSNFSEALLARVSLFGLLADLGVVEKAPLVARCGTSPSAVLPRPMAVIYDAVASWLDGKNLPAEGWSGSMFEVFPEWPIAGIGTLDDWLGKPTRRVSGDKTALLQCRLKNSDAERFASSLVFSLCGARVLAIAGYPEGSEHEYLSVAKTVTHLVWWLVFLRYMSSPCAGSKRAWRDAATKVLCVPANRRRLAQRVAVLGSIAAHAIEGAMREVDEQRVSSRGNWRLERDIFEPAPIVQTLTCSLALGLLAFDEGYGAGFMPEMLIDGLRSRVAQWTRSSTARYRPAFSWFRERLMEILDRYSFPVYNRLWGLKVLIDSALLQPAACLGPETDAHLDELIELERLYKSPLHFTALHAGLTFGLASMAGCGSIAPDSLQRESIRKLRFSQRLYTMRRSYYETIAGLYYLYDDFNDRTIHYNQAIQMAGSEIASYMISVLTESATSPK